jgi:hypothetical protein
MPGCSACYTHDLIADRTHSLRITTVFFSLDKRRAFRIRTEKTWKRIKDLLMVLCVDLFSISFILDKVWGELTHGTIPASPRMRSATSS